MSVEKRKFPYIIISNKGEPVQSINGLVWTFKCVGRNAMTNYNYIYSGILVTV